MINIVYEPDNYKLTIKGHAGGKKGQDIVCAAVSALFYTLASSLKSAKHMLHDINVKDDSGNAMIQCIPKDEYEVNVALVYWTVLNGIQEIAENYSEKVTFVIS